MPAKRDGSTVGLQDIAAALGVSIGTVDRALHNRRGVNPMTKAKVVQMAQTLGYRPNLAARFLSSRRIMRVAAVLPRDMNHFFDGVIEGIFEAARPFETSGVRVEYWPCPWLRDGEAEVIARALDDGVNGLIIAPGAPESIKGLIRKASRINVPVVCVATDAPGTERLTAVSTDPVTSGSIAAEMLGRFLQGRGHVVVVTGSLATATHAEILRGFQETLGDQFPAMQLAATIEAHDDEEEAYRKSLVFFSLPRPIAGVFVSTSNSMPVVRAIDELKLTGRITVITMDLFLPLASRIKDGSVAASIYQRPRTQGRRAFQSLYRFLSEGICPAAQIQFAPHIVMRSNLDLFLKTMPVANQSAEVVNGGPGFFVPQL